MFILLFSLIHCLTCITNKNSISQLACLYNTESHETADNSPGLQDPTKRLFTALSTRDPITGKMGGDQAKRVTFPLYNMEIRPQTNLTDHNKC